MSLGDGIERAERQDSPHRSAHVGTFATSDVEEDLSSSAATQESKEQAQPDPDARHLMDQSPAGSEVSISKKRAHTGEEEDDQMRSAKTSKL
jgi:hypothetical protein